ncbi:MAG: tetratricopeptide repeat protein [Fibrobacteria bacterium]|nr:tetratricopeptide repeat protein [Fibrobacteria bacterium]
MKIVIPFMLLLNILFANPDVDKAVINDTVLVADIDPGINWFKRRAEGADGRWAKAGPIDSAIHYFKIAYGEHSDKEGAVRLMACYYFKGTFVPMSKDERKKVYNNGKMLGASALKKHPTFAPLKYWQAVMFGKWAEVYGKLAAVKQGSAGKMKSMLDDIIKQDSTFRKGAALSLLGRMNHQAPRIPFLLTWPSNKDAIKLLRKAVSIHPENLKSRLFLADVLKDEGKKEEARKILKEIINTLPRADFLIEDRTDISSAEKMLKNL